MRNRKIPAKLMLLCLLVLLTGCRDQVVEKVGILPDRATQLLSIDTGENTDTGGKYWSVQSIEELTLSSDQILISDEPTAHYTDSGAYACGLSPSEDFYQHFYYQITENGSLIPENSIILEGTQCCFTSDGQKAAYSMLIDHTLNLYIYDFSLQSEQLVWQSEDLSILTDYDIEVYLLCQWSEDQSTLLFMPVCQQSGSGTEFAIDSSANRLVDDEQMLSICEALPSLPYVYIYQPQQDSLMSFFIAWEDYALYDAKTAPMVCANPDGSRFFVYFNSSDNLTLAHYIDVTAGAHYALTLTDYMPSFTWLGSRPILYNGLLYLHVNGMGIMVMDPEQGKLVQFYSFQDPIQSFTVYDDTLIVAQPSTASSGVDVTAYLLNLETKQSVLLYHSDSFEGTISHMEMSADGMHLLLEQLSSDNLQKKLIQLTFAPSP